MTFGSAVTADDVPAYLRSVRGGSEASPEVVAEFERRFRAIGRSPLIDITRRQGEELQRVLDARHGAGAYRVAVGMQHSAPWMQDAVDELVAAGCRRILGIALAPQYSSLILGGYEKAAALARERHPDVDVHLAGAWNLEPAWLDSLAERVRETLDALPADERDSTPVVFTAHSLPRRVVDRDPAYIDQLHATIDGVAERCGLPADRRRFAWQSAGHTPEEWLTPDLLDVLPELRARGHRRVVVAPVQFLADHLEILYDLDVAASEQAAGAEVRMERIPMPNASPALVRALADVVDRETAATR